MNSATASRGRRMAWRPRFRLASLFIGMGLIGLVLGYVAFLRDRAQRHFAAVSRIEASGGRVTYEYQYPFDEYVRSNPAGDPPIPRWLAEIIGVRAYGGTYVEFDGYLTKRSAPDWSDDDFLPVKDLQFLQGVSVLDADFTGDGLAALHDATQLESLNLDFVPVTDRGIRHISHLPNLRHLRLAHTSVTNKALVELRTLKSLESLDSTYTGITDEGMEQIQYFRNLRYLNVSKTDVSDAGLKKLEALTNLQFLVVTNTKVTADGVRNFQDHNKAKVEWRQIRW